MIDRVYQTVLTIINKDNRGYLTPDEFNRLANQAQLEIFEGYFLKMFQVQQNGIMTEGSSDPVTTYMDKINRFMTVSGALTKNTTTNVSAYPTDFYKLDTVLVNNIIADEVSHHDIRYVNLSPLTAPVATQPVFTRVGEGIVVYPTTITGVIIDYVRKPMIPNWTYMNDPSGLPQFNDQDAMFQDFELHPSDEQDLVAKILSYTGIVIREADVAQFGQAKDGQITQSEQ